MKKFKHTSTMVLILLLNFVLKLDANEGSQTSEEDACQGNPPATAKVHNAKSEERFPPHNLDDKNDNSKLEKSELQAPSNVDDNNQNTKTEDADCLETVVNSKDQNKNIEESDQPSAAQEEKCDDTKLEETDHSQLTVDAKKQNSKTDETNYKNNLNDVNSYTAVESSANPVKRNTKFMEFLGLPRDASYFFDDLETFVNNNSDNRVSRAVQSKETKGQKSKLSGKGKENIEYGVDEEEEDMGNEDDDEKVNEDDYDEDEDMDSDCQPTPACITTPPCETTTTPCPTTTPCRRTTEPPCTTKCRTTQNKCATKCSRMQKAVNKKLINYRPTEDAVKWDSYRKKANNKKRKYHSRITASH